MGICYISYTYWDRGLVWHDSGFGSRKPAVRIRSVPLTMHPYRTRRSKLELNLAVLQAVKDGIEKPTRIMYAANMSWKPTKDRLDRLVSQGLLAITVQPSAKKARNRYSITERGIETLEYFKAASDLL